MTDATPLKLAPAPAMRLDQAAALLRPEWIEEMTAAGYRAMKAPGSSLPDWPQVEPVFRDAVRREVLGAICAGIAGGFLTINQR